MVLFAIAMLILAALFYSVFCGMPGRESRKEEEREDG